MKSIFLIFMLTTSFNSLILTSYPNPHDAAAAVAAKNPVTEKLFCLNCGKDRELTPCPLHSNSSCSCRMTCHVCSEELVTESMLAEREAAKEELAAKAAERWLETNRRAAETAELRRKAVDIEGPIEVMLAAQKILEEREAEEIEKMMKLQ
jgi:hypothetical protein